MQSAHGQVLKVRSPETHPTLYAAMCEGKEKHPSEAGARAAMQFYQVEGALRSCSGLVPYQCRFCAHWHLGHGNAPEPPGRFGG